MVYGPAVKIADFGMSKDFSQSLAQTRQHIGTLAYLAPELFDDLGPHAAGQQAYAPEPVDVWALGVMLFVMVCADYPFGTDQVWDLVLAATAPCAVGRGRPSFSTYGQR
jgi:serine/threonine protein kinase